MPMAISERQRILLQFTAAREKAETLLRGLLDAKTQSEKHLAETRQEAIAQIHDRATGWLTRYQRDVLSRPLPEGVPEDRVVETLAGALLVRFML